MQKRSEHLERINIELKSKLDEVTALYDASQRDNRNKASEITRLSHELEKTRDQKDQLTRENKKLNGNFVITVVCCQILCGSRVFTDENAEMKSQLNELNRRHHELEIEFRRLENEREELAAAYKEAEAVRLSQLNCNRRKIEFAY